MSKILNLGGEPMAPRATLMDIEDPIAAANALPGEQPKEHSRFHKQKMAGYSQTFKAMCDKCVEDITTPAPEGQTVNVEHVARFYGMQWAEIASKELCGPDPVPLKKDGFFTWFNRMRTANEQMRERTLPISEVKDLEPHGFKLVGQNTHGAVWINSQVALCVNEGGMVMMGMRYTTRPMMDWYRANGKGWLQDDHHLFPHQFDGYRLEELHALHAGLRVAGMSHPNEAELALARGEEMRSHAGNAEDAENTNAKG